MKKAGICSAKIEGRMKRPEYVAAAVSACRRAADGEAVPEELSKNLEAVFSRSGFTKGYLTGQRGRDMFGVRTKEDVTDATERVFSDLRQLYRGERQTVPVSLVLQTTGGELCLVAFDHGGNKGEAVLPLQAGEYPPLPKERCEAQLRKTGGTPFFAETVDLPEQGVPVGVSQLNALRRQALERLLDKRSCRKPIPFRQGKVEIPARCREESGKKIRAYFRSPEQVCEEALQCESIALPLDTEIDELLRLQEKGFSRILLEQPRAFFGGEEQVKALMSSCMEAGFQEFIVGNLGGLRLGKELGAVLHGAFGLNIFNTAALESFKELGLSTAELSFELTSREAAALGGSLPRGMMLYGRQALMVTRNCPLANSKKGCLHCRTPGCLTDRMRKQFPVLCTGTGDAKYAEVLNSVPLWLGDKALDGMDFGVLRFTVENSVESGMALNTFFRQEAPDFDYTRRLFSKGVE